MININTKTYWDRRFSSGDWELKKGRKQTTLFALSQAAILDIQGFLRINFRFWLRIG
jgi:hypothetical protein